MIARDVIKSRAESERERLRPSLSYFFSYNIECTRMRSRTYTLAFFESYWRILRVIYCGVKDANSLLAFEFLVHVFCC